MEKQHEIKCIFCNGKNFFEGYYEIDTDVNVYSTAYNNVNADSKTRSLDFELERSIDVDIDVDVHTSIDNEVNADSTLLFKPDNDEYKSIEIFKYACEDCGYIMSFTKPKKVETKEEERNRKQKESAYDWTNFK